MSVTRIAAALAVLSLTAVPAFAGTAANPAASLTLAGVNRASAPVGKRAALKGGSTILVAGIAAAGVIGGAIALGSGHHRDSTPASS